MSLLHPLPRKGAPLAGCENSANLALFPLLPRRNQEGEGGRAPLKPDALLKNYVYETQEFTSSCLTHQSGKGGGEVLERVWEGPHEYFQGGLKNVENLLPLD